METLSAAIIVIATALAVPLVMRIVWTLSAGSYRPPTRWPVEDEVLSAPVGHARLDWSTSELDEPVEV